LDSLRLEGDEKAGAINPEELASVVAKCGCIDERSAGGQLGFYLAYRLNARWPAARQGSETGPVSLIDRYWCGRICVATVAMKCYHPVGV